MDHSHDDHGHDGHDHGHGHDHSDEQEPAIQNLLWKQIDFDKVITLNESEPGSGKAIIQKTYAERLDPEPSLTSDVDEQLLITVPFTGTVKLHSIFVRSSASDSAPRTLKLFCNRNDLDFSAAADLEPTQSIQLAQTGDVQDVPVRRALFGNMHCLTLFVEDAYGAETTDLFYLGFKGDFMHLNREPVVFLYEKAANPRDHVPLIGRSDIGSTGPRTGQ